MILTIISLIPLLIKQTLDNIDTINIIYEEGYKYIIYFNKIIYDNDNTNYSFSLTDLLTSII